MNTREITVSWFVPLVFVVLAAASVVVDASQVTSADDSTPDTTTGDTTAGDTTAGEATAGEASANAGSNTPGQQPDGTPETHSITPRSGFGSPQQVAEVEAAIRHAVNQGWRELRLLIECQQEDGFNTAEIFANGVGIWNAERQFNLGNDEIRAMLRALRDTNFARMPVVTQGRTAPQGSTTKPRIRCQIRLRLDATAKRVTQMTGVPPAESFQKLAEQLLETCRGPAAAGLNAKHLDDGLEKIARGDLAPEALLLTSHHKPSRQEKDKSGWHLELKGTVAKTRSYSSQTGYGHPMRLELPIEDLRILAGELAAQRPRSLPQRLPNESLTVVTFELLKYKQRFETTRSGDDVKEIDGQRRDRVERIIALLGRLHQRIFDEGESVTPNLAR